MVFLYMLRVKFSSEKNMLCVCVFFSVHFNRWIAMTLWGRQYTTTTWLVLSLNNIKLTQTIAIECSLLLRFHAWHACMPTQSGFRYYGWKQCSSFVFYLILKSFLMKFITSEPNCYMHLLHWGIGNGVEMKGLLWSKIVALLWLIG
jgi:hypothetical protein